MRAIKRQTISSMIPFYPVLCHEYTNFSRMVDEKFFRSEKEKRVFVAKNYYSHALKNQLFHLFL